MLTLIRVANYAIIDEVEIELEPGMSVVTGETGAGKSILVDAVALALGDRADSSVVRKGAARAEISVVFECASGHPALDWLRSRELDDGNSCCLRRSVAAEGRSRAYINNQPVNLRDLKAIGSLLVDIHGQHAHQALLGAAAQRQLLDASGNTAELAAKVGDAHAAWRDAAELLEARAGGAAEHEERLDLLRFQLRDLTELSLEAGEFEGLRELQQKLSHTDRLRDEVGTAVLALYEGDEGTAHALAASASGLIGAAAQFDPALAPTSERLAAVEIEIRELAGELARYRESLDSDPETLEQLGARLDRAQRLARRHRVSEDELPDVMSRVAAEIESLESDEFSVDTLQAAVEERRAEFTALAEQLSTRRRKHARTLSGRVSEQLRQLGMPHGEFEVSVERRPVERADATGLDRIEFLVRLNPGQPAVPLAQAASGGELSRISLALEVVTTGASSIPTYIFDEVDAGIGGGTAEIVGRRLRDIAAARQVLCVTHLPQVASQGFAHYRIVKLSDGRSSRTQVRRLSRDERIEELSRMLGGIEITAATRAHATEMIEQSEAANA